VIPEAGSIEAPSGKEVMEGLALAADPVDTEIITERYTCASLFNYF
jgi:hypothetical protein